MRITILGKTWTLRIVPNLGKDRWADTDSPEITNRQIRVRPHPKGGVRELDTYIHEFLHCADWSKDEEWVKTTAKDIANALWKLGYRRIKKE